ncbi:hypothetical protein QUF88_19740 [Bacillus sp. DX1.1]|uniref:hypothetical protein n=1 Tax=unclassified Bacillus (in: firmicutes) TaxID=185979 RepID=UPI00256FDBA2|nr:MULTISPECIES: hypothetical protein [unclassified Bacillus (in: firmicutes)]MDM5155944.1 hypothetical protein [Bacillus sp. DX1.1]WJE80237.1 hypothetical protein QRE67_17275 [Bacillus sp. DX3.1]
MENFIDKTLDVLLGGNNSTLLAANLIFNVIFGITLIIVGLVLIKIRKNRQKKGTIGSILVVIGLVAAVFNLIRIVF